jgi:hypothetical protein
VRQEEAEDFEPETLPSGDSSFLSIQVEDLVKARKKHKRPRVRKVEAIHKESKAEIAEARDSWDDGEIDPSILTFVNTVDFAALPATTATESSSIINLADNKAEKSKKM